MPSFKRSLEGFKCDLTWFGSGSYMRDEFGDLKLVKGSNLSFEFAK